MQSGLSAVPSLSVSTASSIQNKICLVKTDWMIWHEMDPVGDVVNIRIYNKHLLDPRHFTWFRPWCKSLDLKKDLFLIRILRRDVLINQLLGWGQLLSETYSKNHHKIRFYLHCFPPSIYGFHATIFWFSNQVISHWLILGDSSLKILVDLISNEDT